MNNKIKNYRCFSLNLRRFLKDCGIRSKHKINAHKVTGKSFWIYEIDKELEDALVAYSKYKETHRYDLDDASGIIEKNFADKVIGDKLDTKSNKQETWQPVHF